MFIVDDKSVSRFNASTRNKIIISLIALYSKKRRGDVIIKIIILL